jgi:hypothetical protein
LRRATVADLDPLVAWWQAFTAEAGQADRCARFTDLANATLNKLYAGVGYGPAADREMIRLGPA